MPKKNDDGYWKDRMEALEDEQYRRGAAYYRDVQEQFRKASNSLQMDIEHWYQRLAENNDISYAGAKKLLKKGELDEFKWTVERYIKAGEENAVNRRWMKELENASARYHISYLEAMKLQVQQHAELLSTEYEGGMTEFLRKSFGERFYRTAFEISKGTSVGFNLSQLDERKVDTLIRHPWAQDGKNFSARIWENKEKLVNNLHTELSQCIIRGESPRSAITRLAKTMNVSKAQAGNLIMTESAAIASAAQKECFKELGVERFQFDATLDGITCEVCQGMDQQDFSMSEYEVGVTAPPVHPRCRCCTVPFFDDWAEYGIEPERAARDPGTDKTVYVDGNLKYADWKNKAFGGKLDVNGKKAFNQMKLNFPDDALKVKGVTPEVKQQLDRAMEKLMKEYDIHIDSITVEPAGAGDIFVSGWYDGKMAMVINENANFHIITKRIQARYNSGYFAGKCLEDYVAHEMFHVMVYQDCKTEAQYRARFAQVEGLYEYLKGISRYADSEKSGNEALAEAFVRLRNGEKVPSIAKVLVESYIGGLRK